MLNILFALLQAFASPDFEPRWTQFTLPAPVATESPRVPRSEGDGKWSRTGVQFLAGSARASIGTLGGAVVGGLTGYVIGEVISGGEDRCNGSEGICLSASMGVAILGGVVGAGSMGVWGTAAFVRMSAPEDYPSSGIGPAVRGSMVGALGGLAIVAIASNSVNLGFWPGFVTVMASSSAGAVVLDRYFAVPEHVALEPWVPRPGLEGARLSFAF